MLESIYHNFSDSSNVPFPEDFLYGDMPFQSSSFFYLFYHPDNMVAVAQFPSNLQSWDSPLSSPIGPSNSLLGTPPFHSQYLPSYAPPFHSEYMPSYAPPSEHEILPAAECESREASQFQISRVKNTCLLTCSYPKCGRSFSLTEDAYIHARSNHRIYRFVCTW